MFEHNSSRSSAVDGEAESSRLLNVPKRSNSTPITSVSFSERMSALRNVLSPPLPTNMGRSLSAVTSHQLSPTSSASAAKLMRAQSDSSNLSAGSALSDNEWNGFTSKKTAKFYKLLKTLSLSNETILEEKSKVFSDFDLDPSAIEDISVDSLSNKLNRGEFFIPRDFIDPGIELLRITRRKKVKRCFQIDTVKNVLRWNNKPSSYIRIDKIKYLRLGDEAKNYREEFKVSSESNDLWITIIYSNDSISNNIKALHVLATRKYDFELFVNTLKLLVFINRDLAKNISLGSDNDIFTNFHWNNYVMNENEFDKSIVETPDTTTSETLNFEGVLRLAKRLSVNVDPDYLYALFRDCDKDDNKYLDFDEFKQFVALLRRREEMHDIFLEYADNDSKMQYLAFARFIKDIQGEDFDDNTIKKVFNKFSSSDGPFLSVEDFQNFLKSTYTAPYKEIEEDFTKPLNEYYISSSHNTYLLGRQIGGHSSVEGYIRVLQRGCRCIEIDLWDGQLDNGEKGPVIKHGRSFTSSESLAVVLEAIRKYAFITTPYPLIISLEIHCNAENQAITKQLLCEKLGELLVIEPIMTNTTILPSPEDLKHKILIKVKKTDTEGTSIFGGSSTSSTTSNSTTSASSFSEDALSVDPHTSKRRFIARPSTKIQPELTALGVYLTALKFINFSLPESKTHNHCFSFSEKAIMKMLNDPVKLQSIIKHNKKYLMRLYPSRYRYKSTNFNPILYWSLGVQMVATNWQMFDVGQQINEAMFLVGTKSGYMLKPSKLRNKLKFHDKMAKQEKLSNIKLSLEVISGQQFPNPKDKDSVLSSQVQVEVYGYKTITPDYPSDCTKVVKKNGFNPIWKHKFNWELTTSDPSFVFIRLIVKYVTDDEEDQLGVCVLKFDSLKKGYRHLTIYDLQGEEYIFSKLFVKIDYDIE